MDDVIDFSNLSLEVPVASETPAASSGTSVSLFSTPLSTGSGSTGGDRFGSSVGLFWCRDFNAPCCGVIANSGFNRFCTKMNCETKAHRAQKVTIELGFLYILGTRKDQAILEPSLNGNLLANEQEIVKIAHLSQ
jgi:hypothetical protein